MMRRQREHHESHKCSANHSKFDHFLLTRFAVYGPHGEAPTDRWLHDRFKLFEDYCLPSVRNQTCKMFRWALLVSPDLPEWVKSRLLELGFNLEDLIISHDWRSSTAASAWVSRNSKSKAILTTRLDNDDALATNFVDRLHAKVRADELRVYNFTFGLQLTSAGVLMRAYRSNPFASLLEPTMNQPQTVLAIDHGLLKDSWPVQQIRGRPGWLQVVHESNLANTAKGIPGGASYANRIFILPYQSSNHGLAAWILDLHPFRALIGRILRRLRCHRRRRSDCFKG